MTVNPQYGLQEQDQQKGAILASNGTNYEAVAPGSDGTILEYDSTQPRGLKAVPKPEGGGANAFPVGSVFIAVVSANPATLLGYGTWSAFAQGRMLVGIDSGDADFDTVEGTGGSKTHTHSDHSTTSARNGAQVSNLVNSPAHDSQNHLSPYIVVYMWKRDA